MLFNPHLLQKHSWPQLTHALARSEALAGVTSHAAQALGLQATHGRIAVGCPANFVLWPLGDVAELAYWLGQRPACSVVRQGRLAVDGMGVQRRAA